MLWALLVSCTGGKETELTNNVLYFHADSILILESNQTRLETENWIEQMKDPIRSSVIENWSSIDGQLTRYEFYVGTEMEFELMKFVDDQLDSEGGGSFEGAGLAWSYWEYDLIQADGIAVISHGEMVNNEITLSTVGYGMDGQAEWTKDEYLTPIAKEEWELAVGPDQ